MASAAAPAKVVAVFGATGAQGGAVAKALLGKDGFSVRAVTRNPDSDKAKALADSGMAVVKADLADPATLPAALDGAHAVFLVTDTWGLLFGAAAGNMDKAVELEIAQGKAVVDAAKAAGVAHFVYSGLEDVEEMTRTEDVSYTVPHFDSKGRISKYAQDQGLNTTIAMYSFYADNFAGMMAPKKGEDGVLTLPYPMRDVPMGLISVEDAGHAVAAIIQGGEAHYGKTYGLANESLTISEIADVMTRVSGKEVKYFDVPDDVYRTFPFPTADEMTNMFVWYRDERCVRSREETKALFPALRTFEQWLTDNKHITESWGVE